jgi:tRNA (cytidine/uridine-2'-O-)-methyltransferase
MTTAKYPRKTFNVVLVEPEIPANTGNIGRTCVGTYCHLHLIGPLAFEISDKHLKRAGLDYWPHLEYTYYSGFDEWLSQVEDLSRVFFFSTKAEKSIYQTELRPGDWLVFGKETKGLGPRILEKFPGQLRGIPMLGPIRSLNLATSVAIAVFEGLRQTDFPHL